MIQKLYILNFLIPLKTLSYKRNISFFRIFSHIIFALKTKEVIKKEKPDLIYVAIPPNVAAYSAIKIASKNKKTKIIIDIVDIWPETLPIPIVCKKYFNFLVGWVWKYLRNYEDYSRGFLVNYGDCESLANIINKVHLKIKDNTLKKPNVEYFRKKYNWHETAIKMSQTLKKLINNNSFDKL